MANEKLFIYRELDGLKVTPESNYNGTQDVHKVIGCQWFETAEEVREYFCKYFGCKDSDFVDWSEM